MADHRREARVDLALLAAADLVDGSSHIVVDAPPRHAPQDAEGVVVGVEQHLVGLLRIRPENEGAAVGELEGRIQTVVATRSLSADRRNRSSASAGVFQSSVFRGRELRAAATAAISLALCMLRSVPLGKYWRSSPLVFSLVPGCHGL